MDAKVDGWVVTPRRGKPVEVQGLWHNALSLIAQWAKSLERDGEKYESMARKAFTSFNEKFWCADGGYLYDVIDGPDGNDARLRPNQLFAFSLRYPILHRNRWSDVLQVVAKKLLTPFGLRTLSHDHPDYKMVYAGDLRTRDAAYHQGTVWPWLIGAFSAHAARLHRPSVECSRGLARVGGALPSVNETATGNLVDHEIGPIGC